MKKILATIVVTLFALSLCACGTAENIPTGDYAPTSSQIDIHTTESSKSTSNYEATTNYETTAYNETTASNETTARVETTAKDETTAPDPVATEATTEDTTPVHVHSFSLATCTDPATCACGATQGSPNDHNFTGGKCASCGMADPDFQQTTNVWIPTKGGKKYHKSASCSNMKNPEEVTKSEAESRGFEPCKRCY